MAKVITSNKELYVCVTLYHLYLSLLYINENKSKQDAIIFLSANDSQIYAQFLKIAPVLKKNGYTVSCRLRNKTKDILGLEEIENRKQFQFLQKQWGKDIKGNYILYNFAWNLQYIYSNANLFFKKCRESYFLEEGVLTAINPPQSKAKVFVKKVTGTVIDFYKETKLKAIIVQKPEIYPEAWQGKLKRLDVNDLLSSLSKETQDVILRVFMGDYLDKAMSGELDNAGIIYTQPLSEDGYITEEEKIKYYQEIVQYYSKYGRPIVKLHPRDLTNYQFDMDITVMPAYFPSELLKLLHVRFLYAVGICTSAVATTDAEYRLNINENFLKDKKFKLKGLT